MPAQRKPRLTPEQRELYRLFPRPKPDLPDLLPGLTKAIRRLVAAVKALAGRRKTPPRRRPTP